MRHIPGIVDLFIGMGGIGLIWDARDSEKDKTGIRVVSMLGGLLLLAGAVALYAFV